MKGEKIKKFIILVGITVLILMVVGCSDKTPQYSKFAGENKNWKVILDIQNPESGSNSKLYTISYIGKKKKPDNISYKIYHENNKLPTSEGNGSLKNQEEFSVNEEGKSNPVYKMDIFTVEIKWAKNVEKVSLKYKK
ncbi:hypothetical protein [Bacillus sp. 1P06AnD]|uniref:hypothetical protein n=1 Tax=Bacillus sp. 1P06AnD TaxID=3132208 RepID=UPI00399FB1BC